MSAGPLQGCRVLVLEDDFYLAEDIADALREAGGSVLGPFGDVSRAAGALEHEGPDLAVLDVNLGGDNSFEIGRTLKRRGIHFLFATGYDQSVFPDDLADAAYLTKPISMRALVASLADGRRRQAP